MAAVAGMLNEEGQNVDLYIPRKCSWTNRILRRDDRARLLLASQPPRLYMPIIGFYQGQRAEYAIGWHDDRSGFGCQKR